MATSTQSNKPTPPPLQNHLTKSWRPPAFGLPTDPEAAALRIINNLSRHGLCYTLFLWVVLFITLIPQRGEALICLVITSQAAAIYGLVLRACPDVKVLLNMVIHRWLVVGLFVVAIVVEMVLTRAVKHLVLSMAGVAPVVFMHAVLLVDQVEKVEEMERFVDGEGDGGDDVELGVK